MKTALHNIIQRDYDVVQRSTTWLQRRQNMKEREQNACTMLYGVSATLWYVMIRCGTLSCVTIASL